MKITTGLEYDVKIEMCEKTGIVEVTKYKSPIRVDLANNFKSSNVTNEKQYEENKKKNILKSAKNIMQLVKYNVGQYKKRSGSSFPPTFLTLTFTENVQDFDYANREFSKFMQRLNYFVYGEKCTRLAYIGVPEFQERGAIHYHILFFNLPYVDKYKIRDLWGFGRTRIEIERVKDMPGENLGRYITKYMVKQFYSKDKYGKDKFVYDKETWEGKKVYFASRNLHRPDVFKISQKEYLDISWILEGENFSSDLIVATLDMPGGSETLEIGSKESYKISSKDKLAFLVKALSVCSDKYVKTDFVIGGEGKSSVKKMIRLDKIVRESPKERYARIKENLQLDNKWDSIKDKFVEVDIEYIF